MAWRAGFLRPCWDARSLTRPPVRDATGQPRVEIYPSSPTVFFLKVVPAELTFSADGKQVTLKQNGRETVAKRIADTVPAPAPNPKED